MTLCIAVFREDAVSCEILSEVSAVVERVEMTLRSLERTLSTRVGCSITPPFAMAAVIIALSSGVSLVSPWPMADKARRSSERVSGNTEGTEAIGVPRVSFPSTMMEEPKPIFFAISEMVSFPKATASWAKAVLEEYAIASERDIFPLSPSAACEVLVSWVLVPGSV